MEGSTIPNLAEHPVIKNLAGEIDRLKKRVESLEAELSQEHAKLERLEHEHVHDHEVIEKLEHSTSPYAPKPPRMTVGL
jgi:predicted  nucleic acid-binding Zn-ribbon protein